MKVLDRINSPEDLKALSIEELTTLCEEIRKLIIDTVAERGGHLASSLGAVELTVALYQVFNPGRDKFVWDVGHQAYAHKILTGRKDSFGSLRSYKGLSGFPRREESPYDVLTTGHSSTSISSVLGLACARDLKGEEYKVVAVIGDGSLTAGLALEGINNAGHLGRDMIVVLNDNEMSISENVGALSSYLSRILTGEFYTHFRQDVERFLTSIPGFGISLLKVAKRFEEFAKSLITPGIIFEELGFKYIGPISAHNLPNLIETFGNIKKLTGPILVHVYSKKGKGYKPAEENPELFHGVPPFDKESGDVTKSGTSYTDVFGETLCEMAQEDPRIVAITAAMSSGTGLKKFADGWKSRFFDVGIAEQHAVTFAAGLAVSGFRPYVAIYSTFLQRSIDMIVHDVCLQNLPVVFAVDRAGFVGEDGPTHHGQFDISLLRCIPGLVVAAAADGYELKALLKSSVRWDQPAAIRYPRGSAAFKGEPGEKHIPVGCGELLKKGSAAAVLAVGPLVHDVREAADILAAKGFDITVFNARFIKPLDEEQIREILLSHPCIFTVEENTVAGGFGSAVLEFAARAGILKPLHQIAIPDRFIEHGPVKVLKDLYGLTAPRIASEIERILTD